MHLLPVLFLAIILISCGFDDDSKNEKPEVNKAEVQNPPERQPEVTQTEVQNPPASPISIPTPTPIPEPEPIPEPAPTSHFPFPDICGKIPLPFPIPGCKKDPLPNPLPIPDVGSVIEKEQFLRFHNLKRCWHNAPDIKWNDQLAAEAKAYASRCVFAHAGGNFGENLAMGYKSIIQAQDAWYMEYLRYNFSNGSFSPSTGHFTQMIWAGSTELGCARVQCAQGAFDICRYKAAGNVIGQFQQNVKPLKSDISKCSI